MMILSFYEKVGRGLHKGQHHFFPSPRTLLLALPMFYYLLFSCLLLPTLLTRLFGMHFIGVTGGIASGKSTTSNYLKEKGCPIVDFDQIARDVVVPGTSSYNRIVEVFGERVLSPDKTLNRTTLGEIVFNDKQKLSQLNGIMNTSMRLQFAKEALSCFFSKLKRTVFVDAPLLFESGLDGICTKTVVIYVSKETQLQRLMQRNNLSEADALLRINAQWSLDKKKGLATDVVSNDGTIQELKVQLDAWLQTKINDPGSILSLVKPTFAAVLLSIPINLMALTYYMVFYSA